MKEETFIFKISRGIGGRLEFRFKNMGRLRIENLAMIGVFLGVGLVLGIEDVENSLQILVQSIIGIFIMMFNLYFVIQNIMVEESKEKGNDVER